ncbi:MAG: hypothetical protein ACYTGL_25105, partial [Planctomycetota bacterium]
MYWMIALNGCAHNNTAVELPLASRFRTDVDRAKECNDEVVEKTVFAIGSKYSTRPAHWRSRPNSIMDK